MGIPSAISSTRASLVCVRPSSRVSVAWVLVSVCFGVQGYYYVARVTELTSDTMPATTTRFPNNDKTSPGLIDQRGLPFVPWRGRQPRCCGASPSSARFQVSRTPGRDRRGCAWSISSTSSLHSLVVMIRSTMGLLRACCVLVDGAYFSTVRVTTSLGHPKGGRTSGDGDARARTTPHRNRRRDLRRRRR